MHTADRFVWYTLLAAIGLHLAFWCGLRVPPAPVTAWAPRLPLLWITAPGVLRNVMPAAQLAAPRAPHALPPSFWEEEPLADMRAPRALAPLSAAAPRPKHLIEDIGGGVITIAAGARGPRWALRADEQVRGWLTRGAGELLQPLPAAPPVQEQPAVFVATVEQTAGALRGLTLLASSGNAAFDRSAEALLRALLPTAALDESPDQPPGMPRGAPGCIAVFSQGPGLP